MSDTTNKLRGVNLGGWLVLERWITPSLFEGTSAKDEFSFMQTAGAVEKIERHRRAFITEADFEWLAGSGANAVRIPVGYWLFDGDGPFTPTISYLDWAIEMAEKYSLSVLIDLHGVKGSQNGHDHSGRAGRAMWYKSGHGQDEAIDVLRRIAERYRNSSALWGIELLNEPKLTPLNYLLLRRFYKRAYDELVGIMRPGTAIVFSDAFAPRLFSGTIIDVGNATPVMDIHWYQMGRVGLSDYFKKLTRRPYEITRLQRKQPVIIGEWSGMLSHKTLAGRADEERRLLERRHIEQQLMAYESALGWFYWTYKTEGAGIWDFRTQVESGSLLLAKKPVLH